MKILIIEDEFIWQEYLFLILNINGYDISIAADVKEARKIFYNVEPDVVITDLAMPNGCAIELIEEFKSKHTDIKFIVVSGMDYDEVISSALKAGADRYFTKPVDSFRLVRYLKKAEEIKLKSHFKKLKTIS